MGDLHSSTLLRPLRIALRSKRWAMPLTVALVSTALLGVPTKSVAAPSASPLQLTVRAAVVQRALSFDQFHQAYKEIAGCSEFSTSVHRGCEPWCVDFIGYVYGAEGVATPSSGSVDGWVAWAQQRGLWHEIVRGTFLASDGYVIEPGDVMVYGSSHAGIYVGGKGANTISVHGNFPDGVYTYKDQLTNVRPGVGTLLSGVIEMPLVVAPLHKGQALPRVQPRQTQPPQPKHHLLPPPKPQFPRMCFGSTTHGACRSDVVGYSLSKFQTRMTSLQRDSYDKRHFFRVLKRWK